MAESRLTNRKIFIIIALCMILFIATVLFLLFTETGRGFWIEAASESVQTALEDEWDVEEELAAELQRIRKKGEPITVEEIIPPQIPDEKNAAILYEKAFDALTLSDQDEELLSDLSSSFNPGSTEQAPSIKDLRSIIAENREVLELLRAARNRPHSRFSIDWSEGADYSIPFLADARWCTRLLLADMFVAVDENDTRRAVTDIETGLRLARALNAEPLTLSHLVGYWMSGEMSRAVQHLLGQKRVSERWCKRLFRNFAGMSFEGSVREALITTRVFILDWLEDVREDPEALAEMYGEASTGGWLWYEVVVKPRLDAEKLAFLTYARKQMAHVEKPYRTAREELLQLYEASETAFEYRPLAALCAPLVRTEMAQRDAARAHIGLAQVGLALEAYRNETGHLPETLDDIAEVVEWAEIPRDPFSGQDFVYRREGDEFTLYSIGRNLEDDGGETADRADEGDIVWSGGETAATSPPEAPVD